MLGERWKKLDKNTRQSYIDAVKGENDKYFRRLKTYKSSLSEEQRLALKDQQLRKSRRRFRTSFKKVRLWLNLRLHVVLSLHSLLFVFNGEFPLSAY